MKKVFAVLTSYLGDDDPDCWTLQQIFKSEKSAKVWIAVDKHRIKEQGLQPYPSDYKIKSLNLNP